VGSDLAVLLAVGVLAVLCLVLLVLVARLRASGAASRTEVEALRERLDQLEAVLAEEQPAEPEPSLHAPVEFVITDLGTRSRLEPDPESVPLDGAAFADIVLKETVVKAASLAHGLRRGLAPATRNRIRFEMKQEVRRARKQRRADLKAAQRDLHARQRTALTEEAS
jgi:hypothetical protein